MGEVKPMKMEGNLEHNWTKWRSNFERYLRTDDMQNKSDSYLVNQLIILFGAEAIRLIKELDLTDKLEDLQFVLSKFHEHFVPKRSLNLLRHKFVNFKQRPGFGIRQYLIALNKSADLCEWGDARTDVVKMVFINGIMDEVLKQKLLESDMPYSEMIEFCTIAEELKKRCVSTDNLDNAPKEENKTIFFCKSCGMRHEKAKCPAYKKTCPVCKQENHFAKMCKQKKGNKSNDN